LDGMAIHKWFEKHAQKHKKEIGWWLELP